MNLNHQLHTNSKLKVRTLHPDKCVVFRSQYVPLEQLIAELGGGSANRTQLPSHETCYSC